MRRARTTRACLALLLALGVSACSDDAPDVDGDNPKTDDGGLSPDALKDAGHDGAVRPDLDAAVDRGFDAQGVDSSSRSDAGLTPLVGCLDRPGLARPPSGGLPCELVPPGLSL
jgi:hypothetical protein